VSSTLFSAAWEARNLVQALRDEQRVTSLGPLVVSGMLADQLAKELSPGAAPGAVVVGDQPRSSRAPVAIRIIAGHPSAEDESFVREADHAEIPVVIVQLWPQETWREPYVLSPYVVECNAGEGFPIPTIAKLIATASDDPTSLAARVPVLKDTVESVSKRDALVRSAFLGVIGGPKGASARPVLALEQAGLIARLRALEGPQPKDDRLPVAGGTAVAAIAASYGLREAARYARRWLPRPVADAAVATAGTFVLAELARRLEARGLL
jgi:hypothetical protein